MEKLYILKVKYTKDGIKYTSYIKGTNRKDVNNALEKFIAKKRKEGYTINRVVEEEPYDI